MVRPVEEDLTSYQQEEVDSVMEIASRLNGLQQIDLHRQLTTLVFPPSKRDDATAWGFIITFGLAILLLIVACGPETLRWFIQQLAQWRHI